MVCAGRLAPVETGIQSQTLDARLRGYDKPNGIPACAGMTNERFFPLAVVVGLSIR